MTVHADTLLLACASASLITGADLPTIGKALAPATQLKWLVLRTAGLQGELSCDIILPSLQLLSLTRNRLTVSGGLPELLPCSHCACHVTQAATFASSSLLQCIISLRRK